jgi:hypothetical protein
MKKTLPTATCPAPYPEGAEALNRDCLCVTANAAALQRELDHDDANADLYDDILATRPHLFSSTVVFVTAAQARRMEAVVRAVEAVVALPAYREHVLAWAPASAHHEPATRSVFMGYDFHLGPHGPQLIEINTNAGGALLNTALARAQTACCEHMKPLMPHPAVFAPLDDALFAMFRHEWRLARGDAPLRTVAIVDDAPAKQYLYPEFLLFQRLFRRHGVEATILDPAELVTCHGGLWHEDDKIDLVYNRLTDFALDEPAHAPLRAAYLEDGAVLTPHPRAHALFADKRNLAVLSDGMLLQSWHVPADIIATLRAGIPRTRRVNAANAAELWSERRSLFFKPAAGFGARAAYRGDKVTKRVWEDIVAGDYVAQENVAPSERRLHHAGTETALKLDIRCYVYDGETQLLAARLYQGQTTNFRTPGGGFAPVFISP